MKKIVFAGAYGIKSQGDDAALLAFAQNLQKKIGKFEGIVISRHANENFYERYCFKTIQNMEYDSKSESIGKWFRGFNYNDDRTGIKKIYEEILRSDLLVLGAGNFVIDITIDLLRGPIPYLTILTLMAKMAGTPVMWFGMSVGPLITRYGQHLSKFSADLSNSITVRDNNSYDTLRKIGFKGEIEILPDPVLSILPASAEISHLQDCWREAHKKDGPVIAISVRSIPNGSIINTEDYVVKLSEICNLLIKNFEANLFFIPHCTYEHGNPYEDDRNIANDIISRIVNKEKVIHANKKDLSVEECMSLYNNASMSICTRLHANVYSAIQGVPTIAINYNPKIDGYMNWLKQGDFIVPLSDISEENIVPKVKMLLQNNEYFSNKILKRVEEGRKKADRYVDIAAELIYRNID